MVLNTGYTLYNQSDHGSHRRWKDWREVDGDVGVEQREEGGEEKRGGAGRKIRESKRLGM